MNQFTPARTILIIAAVVETILAIPFIGGLYIISFLWMPLFVSLTIHIVALVILNQEKQFIFAPIVGIIASIVGFVPFVGWLFHVLAAVLYWFQFALTQNTKVIARPHVSSEKTDSTIRDAEIVEDVKKDIKESDHQKDDLIKIEGIGPKIESVLNAQNIKTFAALVATSVHKLKEILAENDLSFHDPTTWGAQAKLADTGKWDELATWQDELKGGKEK